MTVRATLAHIGVRTKIEGSSQYSLVCVRSLSLPTSSPLPYLCNIAHVLCETPIALIDALQKFRSNGDALGHCRAFTFVSRFLPTLSQSIPLPIGRLVFTILGAILRYSRLMRRRKHLRLPRHRSQPSSPPLQILQSCRYTTACVLHKLKKSCKSKF